MQLNKLSLLALISASLVVTGCASRKPKSDAVGPINPVTVSTTGLSEDAALNAQRLQGASALGVTEANKEQLAKRVVYFAFDNSDINSSDYAVLDAHAQFLLANANSKIALTGHTDERGTREYNMALGERRAKSVQSYLMTKGVNAQQLEAVSYGEEMPIASGQSEAAWQQNRRVELNYEAVPPLLK